MIKHEVSRLTAWLTALMRHTAARPGCTTAALCVIMDHEAYQHPPVRNDAWAIVEMIGIVAIVEITGERWMASVTHHHAVCMHHDRCLPCIRQTIATSPTPTTNLRDQHPLTTSATIATIPFTADLRHYANGCLDQLPETRFQSPTTTPPQQLPHPTPNPQPPYNALRRFVARVHILVGYRFLASKSRLPYYIPY